MALTYTPPGELGFKLPSFQLPTVDGRQFKSDSLANQIAVVMFICNHCPYVKAIEDRLIALAHEMKKKKNVQVVGICSNDPTDYPEDAPAKLYDRWQQKNYGFPYLIDEAQSVAKAFGAVCTPDIFVFDKNQALAYRGRLDDAWKNPTRVQKQELKMAIEAILQGQPVESHNPSMGCSIKWKSQ